MHSKDSDWLIRFRSNRTTPKLRLVCFPFAGGGATNYSKWRPDLDETIELCALNLPGRERFFFQPCLTDYNALIKSLANVLQKESNCPTIFFGHSFGALTAYFTALELSKNHGKNPLHVYVSARVPPCFVQPPISGLNSEQFKTILIERYQGIPQIILNNPDFFALFLPIIQNDFKLYEQYPQVLASYTDQSLECGITSISYSKDITNESAFSDWRLFTKKEHQHLQFPGGHFEILANWKPVVDLINQWGK